MAWQKNGTPLTLGSALDDMDITDLTAKKFNVFLIHRLLTSNEDMRRTFNNNSNTVYAPRQSANGGADTTGTSQAYIELQYSATSGDDFDIEYVCSIAGEEKLSIMFGIGRNTAGAGTAPNRVERVMKFVPSPDADITRIDINNTQAGSYAIDSNLSALGTD